MLQLQAIFLIRNETSYLHFKEHLWFALQFEYIFNDYP